MKDHEGLCDRLHTITVGVPDILLPHCNLHVHIMLCHQRLYKRSYFIRQMAYQTQATGSNCCPTFLSMGAQDLAVQHNVGGFNTAVLLEYNDTSGVIMDVDYCGL